VVGDSKLKQPDNQKPASSGRHCGARAGCIQSHCHLIELSFSIESRRRSVVARNFRERYGYIYAGCCQATWNSLTRRWRKQRAFWRP
jgi:hypothetical protein